MANATAAPAATANPKVDASGGMSDFDFKKSKQMRVPLDKIRENKDALRPVDRSLPEYQELVESVRRHGVMNAISVREVIDPTDKQVYYGLIDGLHRFNASIDAGLTDIPVSVGTLEETQLLAAQILANVQKVETKHAQYSKALLKLMAADPTLTKTELATRLSKSTQWLDDRLSLNKLEPNIAKLVDDNKITLTNAYALSRLPHADQVDLKDKAMTESPTVFGTTASNRGKEIAKARREGRPQTPEFIPNFRLHKVAEVQAEITNVKNGTGPLMDQVRKLNLTKPAEVAALALEWAIHGDPETLAKAKADWEQEQKDKKEKQKADAIKREAQKLADLTGKPVDGIAPTPAAPAGK